MPQSRLRLLAFALALAGIAASCGDATDTVPPQDGPWTDVAVATGMSAVAHGQLIQIGLEWTQESWEEDVHSEGDEPHETSAPRREEYTLDLSGGHVRRWTEDGIPAVRVVRGEAGWLRVGAAVVDLTDAEVRAATAEVEDWVTLLGATDSWSDLQPSTDPGLDQGVYIVGGEGRPDRRVHVNADSGLVARIEYLPLGVVVTAPAAAGTLVPGDWQEWSTAAGMRFPKTLVRSLSRGARQIIERTTIHALTLADDDAGTFPARPDDGGPGELGNPERRTVKSQTVFRAQREARLTAIPALQLRVRSALDVTLADRRGPDVLEFESYPKAAGIAVFSVYCPVALSHDAGAGNLPSDVVSGTQRGSEVLAFPYRGAYPSDESLRTRVTEVARSLGLEPAGPLRFAVLSDPVETPPGELEMEILLPVRSQD